MVLDERLATLERRLQEAPDERTATEVCEEVEAMFAEWNEALRVLLDHFDPPPPGPRERHLRLVVVDDEARTKA
jgi:hypothetical protein